MEPIAAAAEDASLVFHFPSPKEMRPPLITLDGAAVGYVADAPVLSHLTFRVDPDDRIALMGRNGNGKTTLARLLAGQLNPMAGSLVASAKLRVGYFAQHQIDELIPGETPLQHMTRLLPTARSGEVRAQLGRFGFSGDKAHVQVRHLSGGERARLALALITREAPHILILDEPTNDLDVDARQALIEALNEYGGAVIVVSHDRHLLELIADRLVLVAEATATEFDGSLDDYRDRILGRGDDNAQSGKPAKRASRKDQRRRAAKARERNQALRKAARQAEAEVKRLSDRRAEIDGAMLAPPCETDRSKGHSMTELVKTRTEVERMLAAAEDRWLQAGKALELSEKGE